jgi:tRNA dimethylallyltransferase
VVSLSGKWIVKRPTNDNITKTLKPTNTNKPIYAIAGPTASGKTALAVELALHVDGEVVNFDSVQTYKGIEIATAKPSDEEKRGVPHHLIDYVDPRVNYTAADWSKDAAAVIAEIESREKIAILVGGTGFYLRSLVQPFFEAPPTDPELRERFRKIRRREGPEHLHRMLQRIDPASAERLFPRDYVRVSRALEFYFQTGEKFSAKQPARGTPPAFASRVRLFVLNPPRDALYAKIDRRTEAHFQNGLVEEVKRLRAARISDETNALGSHGYRRVCEYLRGERTLESAIDKTRQDVRNYAKRQLTWFRREPDAVWLNGFGTDEAVRQQMLNVIDGTKVITK